MATKRTDPPDLDVRALVTAEVYWLTLGGGAGPRGFPLTKIVCDLIWRHDMWDWSDDEMMQKYQHHQQAVDALAVQAGVRPWVLDALDRARAREAAAARWRPAD